MTEDPRPLGGGALLLIGQFAAAKFGAAMLRHFRRARLPDPGANLLIAEGGLEAKRAAPPPE